MKNKCEIALKTSFKKSIRKLSKNYREMINKAISKLSENPFIGEKLKGKYEELRKLRIGKYRIIYDAMQCKAILIILEHRETVYRK